MNLSLEILLKIIYALGIGVLIGLERSLIPSGKSTSKKSQEKENQLAQSNPSRVLVVGGLERLVVEHFFVIDQTTCHANGGFQYF